MSSYMFCAFTFIYLFIYLNTTFLALRACCRSTPFCTSFALHGKATPDCRQEGNQYCTNQYNTQYLAILSEESI